MIKSRAASVLVASLMAACAQVPAAIAPVSFGLGATTTQAAIANAGPVDWSANTAISKYINKQRASNAARRASYQVSAASLGPARWTFPSTVATTGTFTNAVAFVPNDPVNEMGPNPIGGDRLMAISNAPKNNKDFFILDPATGTTMNGAGWDAMTLVGAPAGSKVDGSGLTVNTTGTSAMFVTTSGYFGAIGFLPAATGVKQCGIQLGPAGAVMASKAAPPFIDNSAHPGQGATLDIWCATTNNTLAPPQGTISEVKLAGPTWMKAGDWAISGAAADGSAGVVKAGAFLTSPVVWRGKAYIGDANGRFWEFDTATKTSKYWDLSPFSGVLASQIVAPAAFELDNNDAVTRVFVSCGNRVFWIDPNDPLNTDPIPSQILLVDTSTNVAGARLQGTLNNYPFQGTPIRPYIAATDTCSTDRLRRISNWTSYNQEVVGAYGYSNPNDGDPVSGYMLFNVASGAFAGRVPIQAKLLLCCDSYTSPVGTDCGSIFRTSTFFSNTAGVDQATRWNFSNMNSSTTTRAPRDLVANPFSTLVGPPPSGSSQYQVLSWNISGAIPRDNSYYSFALRGNGKQWASSGNPNITAPGYYGKTGRINGPNYPPRLDVTCSPYSMAGAIVTQPIINYDNSGNLQVVVANSNAIFQLDGTTNGDFSNAAKTWFSLTTNGRTGSGVVDGLNQFFQNKVSVSLSITGNTTYAYVVDEPLVAGQPHLNKFSLPLAGADSLVGEYALPAGSLRTCPFLTWDFFGGSLYFGDLGGTTSTLYRVRQ